MKRRIISLVLSVLLLCSMNFLTVFADEVQEIVPYDSILVADLDTTAWNNVYIGTLPFLLSQSLEVTNHNSNIGAIQVRITYLSGSIIENAKTIQVGAVGKFTLPGVLSLNEQYVVQVRAVNTVGAYGVVLSVGNGGENIYPTQLVPNVWSNVYYGTRPAVVDTTIKVRNHLLSPGAIIVRVVDENNDLLQEPITIEPGEEEDVFIEAAIGENNYLVQAQAEEVAGTYFIIVED